MSNMYEVFQFMFYLLVLSFSAHNQKFYETGVIIFLNKERKDHSRFFIAFELMINPETRVIQTKIDILNEQGVTGVG